MKRARPASAPVLLRARPLVLLVMLVAAALASPLLAQGARGARAQASGEGAASRTRSVDGRVVRPAVRGDEGVAGVTVTLHRVGPEGSGPIDSMRTARDGRYAFRYQPTGSEDALYFVSAMHHGIAYFGSPLHDHAVTGEEALVTVFDTSSAPIPLRVNGRHLIVSSSDAGERRAIVEVFELSNDTTVTRVGGGRDSATFRVPLPAGLGDFEGGRGGDVPADGMALVDGGVEVYAPFAPGIKQVAFSYTLPRDAFPLTVRTSAAAELLEVLLEDSSGTVTGAGLVRQGPVQTSGRTFVRWVSDSVPANAQLEVSFPSVSGRPLIPQFAVVAAGVAALLLFAMRMVASRRVGAATSATALDPDRLAQRIAALDAAHERRRLAARAMGREVDAGEQATYDAERTRLKGELTDALARRDARG